MSEEIKESIAKFERYIYMDVDKELYIKTLSIALQGLRDIVNTIDNKTSEEIAQETLLLVDSKVNKVMKDFCKDNGWTFTERIIGFAQITDVIDKDGYIIGFGDTHQEAFLNAWERVKMAYI